MLLPAATHALPSSTDGSSNRERRGEGKEKERGEERRGDEKTLEERRRLWTKKTNR